MIESAADGILTLDETGRIESFNPAAEAMFGYRAAEAAGRNIRDLVPSIEAVCNLNPGRPPRGGVRNVLAGSRTLDGRRHDGTAFPLELSLSEVCVGNVRKFTCIVRDCTHRRRIEQALSDSEARYRAIFQTAVDAIVVINDKGIIESFNPAAEKMFGYSAEAAIGRNVGLLMPSPYREEHNTYVRNYCETGRRRVIGIGREVVGLRRDGATFAAELAVSEMRIKDRPKFIGLVRDITARKQAEERNAEQVRALGHLNDQLQAERDESEAQRRELEQINAELEQAKLKTEAADRAKTEFLANMSHELRTPLTAILGFAEILCERAESERISQEAVGLLNIIRRNGNHLLRVLNDVLDLSRLESGRMTVEKIPCSFPDIVSEVTSSFEPTANVKGLRLSVHYETAVPRTLHSDPVRLRQILFNLLGNAIKFTESGWVEVRVRYEAKPAPVLLCDVIDSGIGMSCQQSAALFQPFCQGDSSHSRRFSGTGLGLAICLRLCALLGGAVEVVRTGIDEGTHMRLTLRLDPADVGELARPLAVVEPPTETAGPALPSQPSSSIKSPGRLTDTHVLLAEDGVDNQRLITHILKKAGADVTVVENGQLAVDTALAGGREGAAFDVVLMDMQMPVMDGYAATRMLRRRGYSAPIVALTAHAMADDRQKCLDAGCTDYAAKPISRDVLVSLIERHRSAARGDQTPAQVLPC